MKEKWYDVVEDKIVEKKKWTKEALEEWIAGGNFWFGKTPVFVGTDPNTDTFEVKPASMQEIIDMNRTQYVKELKMGRALAEVFMMYA